MKSTLVTLTLLVGFVVAGYGVFHVPKAQPVLKQDCSTVQDAAFDKDNDLSKENDLDKNNDLDKDGSLDKGNDLGGLLLF